MGLSGVFDSFPLSYPDVGVESRILVRQCPFMLDSFTRSSTTFHSTSETVSQPTVRTDDPNLCSLQTVSWEAVVLSGRGFITPWRVILSEGHVEEWWTV